MAEARRELRDTRPWDAPTAHERELLVLLADGHTNKEIARRFRVSPETVKKQLDVLREKLGVPNRTAAVALAYRAGWIA